MSVHLTFRVDEQLAELLEAEARRAGMSRSDFLRLMISQKLTEQREADEIRAALDDLAERQASLEVRMHRSVSLLTLQLCKVTKEDPERMKGLAAEIWKGGAV